MAKTTNADLGHYLADLDAGVVDPRHGLPDPIFQFALNITPMINVDLFVTDNIGRVLVAWREDEFGRGWHIPGGIIRRREKIADRITAVARAELRAEVSFEAEPFCVRQLPNGARGHFISLLFRCSLCTPIPEDAFAMNESGASNGQLRWSGGKTEPIYLTHEIYRDLLSG